jgi:hypothetical protein
VNRIKIALTYSEEWLETDRPQPLSDNKLETLIQQVLGGNLEKDITDQVYENFKSECQSWLVNSNLNTLQGFDAFLRKDIIIGCTQFIDNLYMQGPIQVLQGDYRYHERLNLATISTAGSLISEMPLIVAMPFPNIGAPHEQMQDILEECRTKQIPVHIDGAWTSCCRDVHFDFGHPAIQSVGISLSKGLGLGWNRIGLRWTRQSKVDSITIMNDFRMNNRALVMIGLHFLRNLEPDYLWNKHGANYYKVCADFALTPTQSIYLALRNGQPVGVSPLLRYLENVST